MDIDIRASDEHEYRIVLDNAERTFQVPVGYLARLDVSDAYEPLLVRKSVEYVVEYDLVSRLPQTFTPADIERLAPLYPREISARLAG